MGSMRVCNEPARSLPPMLLLLGGKGFAWCVRLLGLVFEEDIRVRVVGGDFVFRRAEETA